MINTVQNYESMRFKNSFDKRNLPGATDASQSTVTGTGVANFYALTSHSVLVTAKDSGGTDIGTGGDSFYIQITNECTKTSNYECTVVGGADSTLSSDVFDVMTDNSDGTYSYTYTVNNDGKVSVVVILFHTGAEVEFYNNYALTGSPETTTTWSTISQTWTSSDNIFNSYQDSVGAKIYAMVKGPTSGSVTFYLDSNDGASLSFEGTQKFANKGSTGDFNETFTETLVSGDYYYIYIEWGDNTLEASITLSWSYSGQSKITIPSSYLEYSEYVNSSPYTVTVSCPTGYDTTNPSYPNECKEK